MNFFRNNKKIFCISIQRTGTTSVGDFFEMNGFKRAGWKETRKNNWGRNFFDGDYESIFNSKDFIKNEIFEDGPWSVEHFYKVLFHRFPEAQFVLFTRDADSWFNSMVSHSNGMTLGNTFRHCCTYQRETEYYKFMGEKHQYLMNEVDNLMPIPEGLRTHYKDIYINRNKQVLDFFKAKNPNSDRLIHLQLEDENKWEKLAKFFNIERKQKVEVHSNKSDDAILPGKKK